MDAGDSCTVTIIFVDIDWDKVSLSPSPCCTDISPHFFARHWWVPWRMMLTFPPPPSNSSNILPITLGSLRMHHVMRRAYVKRWPPTCVRIWKLNTDTLLHFCFLFFLLLLRIVESSVSVWRVSVNKTQHLNKALVPIRWRPLIICLSPCCLWRQINTSPWHAFFSHFARFLVPRLEQEESRTPWQSIKFTVFTPRAMQLWEDVNINMSVKAVKG